jgi:hypothetical protein
MYYWLVYLHIAGALIFFMAHGVSTFVMFRLGKQQSLDRMRALMELSSASLPAMWLGLTLLLIGGISAGFMGNWWSQGWIGVSFVLMIVMTAWFGYYARRHFTPLRKALGLPSRRDPTPPPPAAPEEIARLLKAANPLLLSGIGFGLSAVILYLMIFKPF